MKIMFSARAIENMAGGVERMITTIMNNMSERGHEIHLLTLDTKGSQAFYPMSEKIIWHQLDTGNPNKKATNRTRINRAIKTRKIISNVKPDVMVGFQDGPFIALSLYTLNLGIPVIAAERNAPTRFNHTQSGWQRKHLTFNAFRLAQSITVQFDSYKEYYPKYLQNKIVHIPNPVKQTNQIAFPSKDNNGRFMLLSVGRLSYQKNYKTLIDAFSQIASTVPDWDLTIYGEGEERPELEKLIKQYQLSERIFLPGKTSNTAKAYATANLFCLPSRWEGFPNAMAEAGSHALPLVGFSECSGVNELISENNAGRLAHGNNNKNSLADTLATLMKSPELRNQLGNNAKHAMSSYAHESIMNDWENLFIRAAA